MKNIIKYSFLFVILMSVTSCKKWLDLKPQDGIVRQDFWKTKEQVSAAVTGIYSSMLNTDAGGMAELFFIWGEARADMVAPGFRANAAELDIVNLNMLPSNTYTNWRVFYQTINYCNTVIELAPGVLAVDNTFTKEQLNTAVGEALTIRALMYFYLTRSFGQVPLKLNATISDENIVPIPKVGSDTILNQIVKDLKQAEPYLPLTYNNVNTDKGRVTRFTVNALLADVYLWMEKYPESVIECNKVIDSRRFGLIGGNSPLFDELFFQGNSNESIFELQFDVQKLNPFYFMHIANSRRWGAAPHIMEDVYGIDLVNTVPLQDLRGDGNSLRASDLSIWKYIGANSAGTSIRAVDQSFAHWIFYRYADILLMKAEAINQLDQPLEASKLVQVIRDRAKALDFNGTMDPTSKSAMEEYILQEREREFAFEGKRWYDLLRNAKRNNYQQMSYLIKMASISIPSDRQQAAFNKLRDKNSHYFPIYLYEMQTNKLLVQNPFYK